MSSPCSSHSIEVNDYNGAIESDAERSYCISQNQMVSFSKDWHQGPSYNYRESGSTRSTDRGSLLSLDVEFPWCVSDLDERAVDYHGIINLDCRCVASYHVICKTSTPCLGQHTAQLLAYFRSTRRSALTPEWWQLSQWSIRKQKLIRSGISFHSTATSLSRLVGLGVGT